MTKIKGGNRLTAWCIFFILALLATVVFILSMEAAVLAMGLDHT